MDWIRTTRRAFPASRRGGVSGFRAGVLVLTTLALAGLLTLLAATRDR